MGPQARQAQALKEITMPTDENKVSGLLKYSVKTTAADMARSAGIDPKRFRVALRRANFAWHRHNDPWEAWVGSDEHRDMQGVLTSIASGHRPTAPIEAQGPHSRTGARGDSDEAWTIDVCDDLLGQPALRQHRFGFLLGDPGAARQSR